MAKKVWMSLPLVTTADLKEESVVTFLKGGQKKELEVEVAAFVTKWLMDKDVPFGIDFDSCGIDRAVVIESLPKRLQKILGASIPVAVETTGADAAVSAPGEVAPSAEAAPVEQAAAASVEDAGGVETVPAADEVAAEPSGSDGAVDGASELR
jgi:hypothetical protein